MDGKGTRRCRKGDTTIPGENGRIFCINKSGKKYKPNIWTNRGKYMNRTRRSKRSKRSKKSSKKSRKSSKRSRK